VKRHRIELDFAERRRRRTPRVGFAFLLVGALLAVVSTLRVTDALASHAAYRASLQELEAKASGPHPKPVAKVPVDGRAKARGAASKQVAQALQSPWAELLEVIDVKPEGEVALLSVEPSAVKRTVHITAEARNEAAMLEHLSLLQQDPRLSGVTLTSHQRQTQVPGAPWRYQIQGSW
jgi:hypothetical protein